MSDILSQISFKHQTFLRIEILNLEFWLIIELISKFWTPDFPQILNFSPKLLTFFLLLLTLKVLVSPTQNFSQLTLTLLHKNQIKNSALWMRTIMGSLKLRRRAGGCRRALTRTDSSMLDVAWRGFLVDCLSSYKSGPQWPHIHASATDHGLNLHSLHQSF